MKSAYSLALALLCISSGGAALASDPFPKAFDAVYESKTSMGKGEMHISSNGKGKLRTESNAGGYKVVSITDYPNNVAYSIIEAQKMVTKTHIKEGYSGVSPEDMLKKKDTKDLGTKLVEGHMCHGWLTKTKDSSTETWADSASNELVKSVTTAGGTTSTMILKSLKYSSPAAESFNIPTGYKVMSF